MDDKLQQAYLYDFYGELLNERQRQMYEDFHFNDLSLGEIAAEEGISRQGVADMVKRCEKKLISYEKKLHLVARFLSVKADAEEIRKIAEALAGGESARDDAAGGKKRAAYQNTDSASDDIARMIELTNRILKEL